MLKSITDYHKSFPPTHQLIAAYFGICGDKTSSAKNNNQSNEFKQEDNVNIESFAAEHGISKAPRIRPRMM